MYHFFYYICFVQLIKTNYMPTSLIIVLVISIIWVLLLAFSLLKSKKKITQITKQLNKVNVTQLDLYKQFAEEVLIDCGFPLENVYIKPTYDNGNGVIFNKNKSISATDFTSRNLTTPYNYSNVFKAGETYMILPEIKDLYTLHTWLHEIGHYMQNHLNDTRPTFTHEYEAEMYANTIIKLCPILPKEEYYSKDYNLLMHNAYLTDCINSGKEYVKSYIDKELETYNLLYLSNDIESFINTKLKYPE